MKRQICFSLIFKKGNLIRFQKLLLSSSSLSGMLSKSVPVYGNSLSELIKCSHGTKIYC